MLRIFVLLTLTSYWKVNLKITTGPLLALEVKQYMLAAKLDNDGTSLSLPLEQTYLEEQPFKRHWHLWWCLGRGDKKRFLCEETTKRKRCYRKPIKIYSQNCPNITIWTIVIEIVYLHLKKYQFPCSCVSLTNSSWNKRYNESSYQTSNLYNLIYTENKKCLVLTGLTTSASYKLFSYEIYSLTRSLVQDEGRYFFHCTNAFGVGMNCLLSF